MTKLTFIPWVAILTTELMGCATQPESLSTSHPPVDPKNVLPLAAEFTTSVSTNERHAKHVPTITHWRLLRAKGQIEVINLDSNSSEIWRQTSQDLWFYLKAFHQEQQVIEYTPVDLKVLEVKPQWSSLALGINPDLLKTITATQPGKAGKPVHGWQTLIYKSHIGETSYEVHWLPQLAVAARVKNVTHGVTTVTAINQPFLLASAPWKPSDISGYRLIEYADLGDMERDPFVIKVQHQLLGAGQHAH